MNLIEALKTCKETGGRLAKNSWTTDINAPHVILKDYYDYTIPSYIYWNPYEEAFVAVFAMDVDMLPDKYARIPEDYMGGVIVSNFSVQDILADDWRVFGGTNAER